MKILQVNTVYRRGSTGKIAEQIQAESIAQGIENVVAYRYCEVAEESNTFCISTWLDCHLHNRIARYTHRSGFYSKLQTEKFVRYIEIEKPDIIHLHNLHGSYVNIKMLFDCIRQNSIKVIWTFHDCWPFTGYCPYFEINDCRNWQTCCCNNCPEENLFNNGNANKNLISKINDVKGVDLTVVTPSHWLSDIVKQTFYSKFDVLTIHNGIDRSVFYPRKSDFREKNSISESKFMLLGVAAVWEERKGLDVFVELSRRLNPECFQIVLVGTTPQIDVTLPKSIISIHKTEDQAELAEIYSSADLFVNPTREEVLGLVNIEANACGTPVVTYNTGGCPECINDKSGLVVERDDLDALEKAIYTVCTSKPFSEVDCVKNAERFDSKEKFDEYVNLYRRIGGNGSYNIS